VERLAVVVRVEDDGASCARRDDLAEYDGWSAGDLHEARLHAALLEQGHHGCGVPADVRLIARQVGNGKEFLELAEDGLLVALPPAARGGCSGILRGLGEELGCQTASDQRETQMRPTLPPCGRRFETSPSRDLCPWRRASSARR